MDVQTTVSIIQSVGFPVVMCGAMGWFVYYMFNKNDDRIAKMNEQHTKEIQELQQAIDNNTIALTKMIEVINKNKT